jgi:hypothetical protein
MKPWITSGLAALVLVVAIPLARATPADDIAAARAGAEKLATTDSAETLRRWGPWTHFLGKSWVWQHANLSSQVSWFSADWAVPGAAIEFAHGSCFQGKCTTVTGILVYSPELSDTFSIWNPRKLPAFQVFRSNGRHDKGVVFAEDYSSFDHTSYAYDAKRGVRVDGMSYREVSAQELAQLTGSQGIAVAAAPSTSGTQAAPGSARQQPAAPQLVAVRANGGPIQVGRLGITFATDPGERAYFQSRPRIEQLAPDGAAAKAGLQAGDAFQSIGGIENPTVADVLRVVALAPGKAIPVVVLRNGQSVARSVALSALRVSSPCAVLGYTDYQYNGQIRTTRFSRKRPGV